MSGKVSGTLSSICFEGAMFTLDQIDSLGPVLRGISAHVSSERRRSSAQDSRLR